MSENVEQEARQLGWVPQEEFRGEATRWVDAQTFLDRGHTVMPILKATNRRLEGEVERLRGETAKLQQLFTASQESISELQKVHMDNTKAAVERAKREVLSQLKQAKEDGNIEAEVTLTDQLSDIKDQQRALDAAATQAAEQQRQASQQQQQQQALDPEFQAWVKENTWFGQDNRKTLRAMGIAQELRADPEFDALQGRAFFDKVLSVMDERTNGGAPPTSKVGSGRPSGGGGSGGGKKGYNDLDADAKAACDRQAKKLVGEGRAFKDTAAWRQYYADMVFGEQA